MADFTQHVEQCRPLLIRVASRYVSPAEAEDCVQRALIDLWREWDTYDPLRSQFSTWAMRKVLGQILNSRRGEKRLQAAISNQPPTFPDTSPEALATMHDLLDKLSPEMQLVAIRVFVEGHTWDEVEQELGRNVKMAWLRAIRGLRTLAILTTPFLVGVGAW